MIPTQAFHNLTSSNHRITSPEAADYNCIAWAVGDVAHWWQPGVYWPTSARLEYAGIEVLRAMFRSLGFESCSLDASIEAGFEKVALYGDVHFYTHAARQLPNGNWTSKLGRAEDIEHESPNDVAGGVYGQMVEVMKRPNAQ